MEMFALVPVKQNTGCWPIITFILMIVTATGTILATWSLLQPIHNELADKYLSNSSLFYTRNSVCHLIDADGFNLITLPVACFVTLLFTIHSKRISCLKDKLKSYIAPPVPLDFYNHIQRKLAVVTFTVVADELLHIFNEIINGNSSNSEGNYKSI